MPLDPRLENFETSLADILQADNVQTLEAKLHFLNILDDPIKKFCVNNKLANFTPHLRIDSLQCFLMMNMLVNLRFVVQSTLLVVQYCCINCKMVFHNVMVSMVVNNFQT